MKKFALFQAIGWPIVLFPATVLVHELSEKNFEDVISACSYEFKSPLWLGWSSF